MSEEETEKAEDKRYLVKHRRIWRVAVNVPRDLQSHFGKTKLQESLQTEHLPTARRKRWAVVARLQAQIDAARGDATSKLDAMAARLRDQVKRNPGDWASIDQIAEQLSEEDGVFPEDDNELSPRGMRFHLVAHGAATPFLSLLNEWKRQVDLSEKTIHEWTTALKRFDAFLKQTNDDFMGSVTGRHVMDWRDELLKDGLSNGSINKSLSGLSSYMKFCVQKEVMLSDFTKGKNLPKKAVRQRKRYSDEELVILFEKADPQRQREMAFALTTGVRLAEQWDIRAGMFSEGGSGLEVEIPGSKTDAAKRWLPVPSLIEPVVRRMLEGKAGSDFLFEAPPAAKLKARGSRPSRLYLKWMRTLDGIRHDQVDWHSFRRRCAHNFELAAVAESTAARVLGHESRLGISYQLYSGRAELGALKRAMDDAVSQIPAPVREIISKL